MAIHVLEDIILGRACPDSTNLMNLKNIELEFLCRVLGCPYSGSSKKKKGRILTTYSLRMKLKRYRSIKNEIRKRQKDFRELNIFDFRPDPGIAYMMKCFKVKELKEMCRSVHLSFADGRKKTLCIVLLNWREKCRFEGNKFLDTYLRESKRRYKQVRLF